MNSGMLWRDDTPSATLEDQVRRAARHYKSKYGVPPDTCLVHHSMMGRQRKVVVGAVIVRPHHPTLKGHLWIGCENSETVAVSL